MTAAKRIMGNLKREHRLNLYPLMNVFGFPSHDRIYTFDNILQIDNKLKTTSGINAKDIYFIKSGGKSYPHDYFIYIHTHGFRELLKKLRESHANIGYHVSYEAGDDPELISKEVAVLTKVVGEKINYSRNHYLNSKKPEDFYKLIEADIINDFTMGYADFAGFRLCTCRAVKWIDPYSKKITDLNIYPLTIMECSLFSHGYMAMNFNCAYNYSSKLIKYTYKYNGDLSLLWHNQVLLKGKDEMNLYSKLIDDVSKMYS